MKKEPIEIFHYKQFDIHQKNAGMKVGTDSDLLGTLAAGGKRILDIGTGTGVLSLMMAQRCPDALITAIEIDDNAVKDAEVNFGASKFGERITLKHTSFQDYLREVKNQGRVPEIDENQGRFSDGRFDCVICNPPYFHRSTECPDLGRTRARHSSSLPFRVLIEGAYELLTPDGVFSVCIPPEVLSEFKSEGIIAGFWLKDEYRIQSLPNKAPKRYVLVFSKSRVVMPQIHTHSMRNADRTRSDWYVDLMKDFLDTGNPATGCSRDTDG